MEVRPPQAKRQPVVRSLHGVDRVDDFAWLRDVGNPEVIDHLRAERAHYDAATRHLHPLVRSLFAETSARVPPTDRSVSWDRTRFVYYTESPAGSDYARLCRFRDRFGRNGSDQATILLDEALLSDGSMYVHLGCREVSPDERLLAYSLDTPGDEAYELRFRHLDSLTDLTDRIYSIPAV